MPRVLAFATLAIFISACASLGPVDEEQAELHLRMGTSLLENGNYPQALSELLKAKELDDRNPVIENNLGLTYFARERFDLAEKHIRRAIELKPDYTDAKNNLGRVLIETQKFSEADLILKAALQDLTFQNPEKPYLNLGLSSFRQKKYAEAKKYLLKSIEFQRTNCTSQTLYGRSLLELRDYSGATAALDRAIGFCQSEQQSDEPQYFSALAYYQAGDQRRAETRLEEITKLYPNGRYYDRARSMLEMMRK